MAEDFPAPFGPTEHEIRPSSAVKETPASTGTPRYRFVASTSRIAMCFPLHQKYSMNQRTV